MRKQTCEKNKCGNHDYSSLEHNRPESLMILAVTPGRRWEIEFFLDGHAETESFVSEGVKSDQEAVAQLAQFWRDQSESGGQP